MEQDCQPIQHLVQIYRFDTVAEGLEEAFGFEQMYTLIILFGCDCVIYSDTHTWVYCEITLKQ